MKRLLILFGMVSILAISGMVQAATTIDFDAVALRPANDGSGENGTIVEYPDGTGVTAIIPKAGQKVYYGTDYFNSWELSSIDYLEFTYKRANGGNNPYSNVVITDGAGNFGIISSQGGYTIWENITATITEKRIRYYFAGDSGNQAYGFKFYDPSPEPPLYWGHGTNIVWSDIQSWSLLGVGVTRPLHSGEGGSPRGPVDHGLAIMWGDSLDNYLGARDIYDVTVFANGQEYVTGVIPAPGAVLLGGIGAGMVGWLRRRRNL
jgi:hypothetical protein